MKFFKYLLICVFLTSCAQSSGVLKLGPDTYNISVHAAPVRGGVSGAKKIAISKANQHCFESKKEILVTNINTRPSSHLPGGTADINFKCLNINDPDLVRPSYEKEADIVIKNK
jgi:hypothetical protein